MARPENIRDLEEAVGDEAQSVIPQGPVEDTRLETLLGQDRHSVYITDRIFPWWSRHRDKFLWETVVQSDMLSSAINITSARLFSVPFNIIPKDNENRRQREVAEWSDLLLKEAWSTEIYRAIIDWQTQDNGMFLEILGAGDPAGPIEPTLVPGTNTYLYGLGMRHLDAQRAIRTNDPTYPVKYRARDARGRVREYKLHRSRVLFTSQMESPRERMLKVGFCGASRCIAHVLHMNDIDILKEEWLGSRPISEIIFGKGLTNTQIKDAFDKAEEKANAAGRSRYAQIVYLGITGNPEMIRASGLERIPLKRLPEGWDEEKSVTVAINIVAMALGFDARTLWPATVRGATRADAEVQHLKTMKMTPGIWVETMKRQLTRMFCPNSCMVTADQQDDEQDAIKAENQRLRAEMRNLMLQGKQIDLRVNWEMMLEAGDLTEKQFEYLIKLLDTGKLVDPVTAPPVQPGSPTDPSMGSETQPGDGDGDGIADESPAGSTAGKEDFPAQGLIRDLVKTGEVSPIANGYH